MKRHRKKVTKKKVALFNFIVMAYDEKHGHKIRFGK